jgi:adenylosuccinate lyase
MISRYEDNRIATFWSRSAQVALWARIEMAWMQELSSLGYVALRDTAIPTAREVQERERTTHHEFVAFLDVWEERLDSEEAKRWLHFGLTSSDVIDTATVMQLNSSHTVIAALARELRDALWISTDPIRGTQQVGRTHGQWAQPRDAKLPVFALWDMLSRQIGRVLHASADLSMADFSGPTGGRNHLDADKVVRAMKTLNLRRASSSTQILPRDSWVAWATAVVGLVTVCEAIAEHYWHLAQSEVGEVEVVNGAGSSAMPHKRGNPHLAENVMGLGRMARAMLAPLAESMIQRGDRDLAHSSVERVLLPDLCHLAATALKRTVAITTDYQYAPERIRANLVKALHERVDSALAVSELVESGSTRRDAIENTRKESV